MRKITRMGTVQNNMWQLKEYRRTEKRREGEGMKMEHAAPFETAMQTLWQKLKLVPNASYIFIHRKYISHLHIHTASSMLSLAQQQVRQPMLTAGEISEF